MMASVSDEAWNAMVERLTNLETWRDTVIAAVSAQSLDEGLWFEAQTAPEAYLQQELRALHRIVEGK